MKKIKNNLPMIFLIILILFFISTIFIKNISPKVFISLVEDEEIKNLVEVGNRAFFTYDRSLPYGTNLKDMTEDLIIPETLKSNNLIVYGLIFSIVLIALGLLIYVFLNRSKNSIEMILKIAVLIFLVSIGNRYNTGTLPIRADVFWDLANEDDIYEINLNKEYLSLSLNSDKNISYTSKPDPKINPDKLVMDIFNKEEDKSFLSRANDFTKTPKGVSLMVIICIGLVLGVWKLKNFIEEINELGDLVQIDMNSFKYDPKIFKSFDDIRGYSEEITTLQSILNNPNSSTRSILIQGPRGMGKTSLTRAALNEFKDSTFCLSGIDLITHYSGGGNQILEALFKNESNNPRLIVIEDLDLLNEDQFILMDNSPDKNIIHNLKVYMDILKKENIFLIISLANIKKVLDKGLSKKDFDLVLDLKLPNSQERKEIIDQYKEDLAMEESLTSDKLAQKTKRKSPLQIYRALYDVNIKNLEEEINNGN